MFHRRPFVTFRVLRLFAAAVVVLSSLSAFGAQGVALQAHEEMHVHPAVRIASIGDIQNSAAKVTSEFALGPLTTEERSLLTRRDASDLRARVGLARNLTRALVFDVATSDLTGDLPAQIAGGLLERRGDDFVWTAAVASEGAGALRLNIVNTTLPSSARVFVYSSTGEVHGPYTAADLASSFWTNTVFADRVFVEVQFAATPADRVHLEIKSILHLEHPQFAPPRNSRSIEQLDQYPCFMTSACVPAGELPSAVLQDRAKAIAAMQFISADDGQAYVCTGGLLNDNDANTVIPYFLTANHCIGAQSEASSLELFWDYKYASCNGIEPNRSSMPRQIGATLLATGAKGNTGGADFAFLRLNNTPPGTRWYLGWDATDIRKTANVTTYRLHHPNGEPLHYSRQLTSGIDGTPNGYGGYIFSTMSIGANYGGSSGSPVFTYSSANGAQVVGNLSGSNATSQADLENYCNYTKYLVRDGAFSEAFSKISQWLNGSGSPVTPQACSPNDTTLCLVNKRFSVTVAWNDGGSQGGSGHALPYTDATGLFWFSSNDNVEMLVKVLDACGLNNRIWVFGAAATTLAYDITVLDNHTGTTKVYHHDNGKAATAVADTSAFATCGQ
jgi:lysyl endopeptidase